MDEGVVTLTCTIASVTNVWFCVFRCKQGKVDNSLLLVKKITCSHENVLICWKSKKKKKM